MKTKLIFAALLSPTIAFSAGSHAGGHGHSEMAIGSTAKSAATRTVQVIMREDYNGDETYIFEPRELSFAAGETVRLEIKNEGEEIHEFVMDTPEANAEHKVMMEKFPSMEHDDPNAVRLNPGESAEIIWTFENAGEFEFACLLPGHYEAGMHGPLSVK